MKYSNVMISSLNTIEECDNAIESIESDYKNIKGGFDAWNSGYECDMLSGATRKIEAIQNKSDKMYNEQFPEYCEV